ncbi:MAG: Ig-like domain-containing protein [Methanomassiliicoccales archaeon]|nr:MAG: Ig-like domain-containing protein [Methanomassiliicoccales archaeon]
MYPKTRDRWGNELVRDKDGGIEGLPLQLMILVLIAGVGSAVMMGWMANLDTPTTISEVCTEPGQIILKDLNGDGIYTNDSIDLMVHVVDNNGNDVSGAVVILNGCNVATSSGTTAYGTTDSTGHVLFKGLRASHVGSSLGFITVTITKGGSGSESTYSIPVVCG